MTLRRIVLGYVMLFAYGTVVHVVQLAEHAYVGLPDWLAFFYTALVVVDPTVALALWRSWRPARAVATTVLALDTAANAYANLVLDERSGLTLGRAGVAVLALLTAGLFVVGRRMALSPSRSVGPDTDRR